MLASLTLSLALAPERGLRALRTWASPPAEAARPLLQAAGLAALPIVAAGVSSAIPESRSVGAIVTALMAATLVYLGGAVAAVRTLQAQLPDASASGAQLGAVASAAVSLAGLLGAFGPPPLRLFAVGIGAIWAYVCVFRGVRALRGFGAVACARTALWGALISSGPAWLRLALPD